MIHQGCQFVAVIYIALLKTRYRSAIIKLSDLNRQHDYLKKSFMIEEKLKKMGLLNKEIVVYLMSLRIGPQPIGIIASRSNFPRTTVYDIFKNLIKKGLASKTEKGSTTYFQVLDPQNLISYLEREKNEFVRKTTQQQQEIADILPALKSLENPLTSKPKVKFYEGEKGMRQAYEDTLTSAENIRAYANAEEMHKGLPNFFPEYYPRRADAKIHIRAICPDNATNRARQKLNKKELRDIKFVPHYLYNFSPEINIYDNKVLIASWQEKMAIIIESKEIAELHKKMYDLLWSKL